MTDNYLNNIDLNTLDKTGIFCIGSNCTNCPNTGGIIWKNEYCSLYVCGNGSNNGVVCQIFVDRDNTIWSRINISLSWTSWKKYLTYDTGLYLEYVGAGVDSGQNERNPYFDFDGKGLGHGWYLCYVSNENLSSCFVGMCLIFYDGFYLHNAVDSMISSKMHNGQDYAEYFYLDGNIPSRVHTHWSVSWNSNIYVYKISIPSQRTF